MNQAQPPYSLQAAILIPFALLMLFMAWQYYCTRRAINRELKAKSKPGHSLPPEADYLLDVELEDWEKKISDN